MLEHRPPKPRPLRVAGGATRRAEPAGDQRVDLSSGVSTAATRPQAPDHSGQTETADRTRRRSVRISVALTRGPEPVSDDCRAPSAEQRPPASALYFNSHMHIRASCPLPAWRLRWRLFRSAWPRSPQPAAARGSRPQPAPARRRLRPARSGQPTFRVAIDLVTTDVIARDDAGQFVADLKKDDFEIYEDGVRQEIATFTLVHGGRVLNQLLPPPPPPQEGIILPPRGRPNDTAGRILLFFVDDLHLDFGNTPRLRQLFQKIGKELVHEGDMFGVVSTGTSSIAIDLTYDRKRLDEAIKKMSGGALKPSEIIEAGQGPNGPSELRYRAHVAFSTAYDMVRNLEKIHNRRKAVVYVSNGYDFNPFEGRAVRRPEHPRAEARHVDARATTTTRSRGRATSSPMPIWCASCRS